MIETSILQLRSTYHQQAPNDCRIDYALIDKQGELSTPPYQCNKSEQSNIANHKQRIIALLPADEVILAKATLPAMKKSRLLQAIPYALEDMLSENINHYHFALLQVNEDNDVFVAIIEKNRLKHWQHILKEQHIEADVMLPTTLAIPHTEGSWQAICQDNQVTVRTGLYSGFSADLDSLSELLQLHLDEAVTKPDNIVIYHEDNTAIDAQALSQTLGISTQTQPYDTTGVISQLAQGAIKTEANLLQGKFRGHSRHQQAKRLWQVSFILIALWLLLILINAIVLHHVYSHKNATLNQAINKIYMKNFPGATDIVAPRIRLQEKLNDMQNHAKGNPYLDLLARSGAVLHTISTVDIRNIAFSNKALNLSVATKNFSDLRSIVGMLKQRDLNVTQQNAKTVGNTVSATLIIKE